VRRAYKLRAYPTRPQEGRAGYPRFKPYSRFSQVTFVDGDGAKWHPADSGRWARARFQAVGTVKVRQHRCLRGTVKTLQLKREHRRWYVIVVTETEAVLKAASGRKVGVEMGIARFLTTSDGEIVANPRFLATAQDTIGDLQRREDRARRGSGNRERLRRKLAREYRRVRNQRRDFHHKTARALADACDVIALEHLHIANMTRSAAGTIEEPGRHVAQKSGLNTSILDAGWGLFIGILAGKAEEAGRRLILVNPAGTSLECHLCGARCNRPRQDTVICPRCGPCDADVNAARNIYARAGLGSGQTLAA
jgi:putative transposase